MEYQIGDFSKISRMSIKTLRYYHEIGLLSPTRIDSQSGYRYYDESCLERARVIEVLKALKFSLNDIRDIVQSYDDDSDVVHIMKNKLEEVNVKIAEYREIQAKLNAFIKNEESGNMPNNREIVVKNVTDIFIASIRFKGTYSDVGLHIGKLFKYCGRFAAGKPFSLYYDREYKEDDADIEICLPISREINKDEVKSRVLKGGQVISVIHQGPYETIGQSYKVVLDYVNKNGIKTSLPSREIYLKGPGMIFKGNPLKYLTEIQLLCE